jgi:hypothetical protein
MNCSKLKTKTSKEWSKDGPKHGISNQWFYFDRKFPILGSSHHLIIAFNLIICFNQWDDRILGHGSLLSLSAILQLYHDYQTNRERKAQTDITNWLVKKTSIIDFVHITSNMATNGKKRVLNWMNCSKLKTKTSKEWSKDGPKHGISNQWFYFDRKTKSIMLYDHP